MIAGTRAEEVQADFMSDFFRKVTAPEEGEEIYMYLVAVIIGIVGYLIYQKWEESHNGPTLD